MSKKKLIDAIEVKIPCGESWDKMQGNDKIRFCSHCSKDVNNISEMTRKEAVKLIRRSGGQLCVQYVTDPARRRPLFSDTLYQIRRSPRIAAGVMTASIAFAAGAYAQTAPAADPSAQVVVDAKPAGAGSALSGYVTDQNGAALPFALVSVLNEQTYEYRVINASGEGFYEFKDLPAGTYKLKVEAGGFSGIEMSVSVSEGSETRRDAHLSVQQVEAAVDVRTEVSVQNFVTVGVVSCDVSQAPVNKLVEAVYDEDMEEITNLIAKGYRVNSRDKNHDGITPLHAAVEMGNVEIAQFLLSSGAKINARDSLTRTPLMMMDSDATPELLQLLLRYGAKVDLVDKERLTAAHHLAGFELPGVLRLLVMAGANINLVDKSGATPLRIAAREGAMENVRLLLESGADVNLGKKKGPAAWESSIDDDIKEVLVSYGAAFETR